MDRIAKNRVIYGKNVVRYIFTVTYRGLKNSQWTASVVVIKSFKTLIATVKITF